MSLTIEGLLEEYGIPSDAFDSQALSVEVANSTDATFASILDGVQDTFLHSPSSREPLTYLTLTILLERPDLLPTFQSHSSFTTFTNSLFLDTSPNLFLLEAKLISLTLSQAPGSCLSSIPLVLAILARALFWQRRKSKVHSGSSPTISNPNPNPNPTQNPNPTITSERRPSYTSKPNFEGSPSSTTSSQPGGMTDGSQTPPPAIDWKLHSSSEVWQAPSSILASPMLHNPTAQLLAMVPSASETGGSKGMGIGIGDLESPIGKAALMILKPLYAYWPMNLLAFTKSPEGYLGEHGAVSPYVTGWAGLWSSSDLTSRLTPLISQFTFNLSILSLDAIAELSSASRFAKLDTAELVTIGDSLYLGSIARTAPLSDNHGILSDTPTKHHSSEGRIGSGGGGLESSLSLASPISGDIGYMRRRISSPGLEVTARAHPIQIGHNHGEDKSEEESLRKEVEALKLELKLSQGVSAMYLKHVKRLHSRALAADNDEVERQNLRNYQKLQSITVQTKIKETEAFRAERDSAKQQATAFNDRQRATIERNREAARTWQTERSDLIKDKETLKSRLDVTNADLSKSEQARLKLEAEHTTIKQQAKHLDDYKAQIAHFQDNQLKWDQDQRDIKVLQTQLSRILATKVETERMLASKNSQMEEMSKTVSLQSRKITQLEDEAAASEASSAPAKPFALPESVSASVAAMQKTVQHLQEEVEQLKRDKLNLEAQLDELSFAQAQLSHQGQGLLS